MQRLSIEELEPGMLVGRTIVNSEGKPLLVKNTALTEHYISRLKTLGLTSIYVKNDLSDVEIPEVVSSTVRISVTKTLKNTFQNLPSKGQLDTRALKKGVSLLADDIMSNRDVLFGMYDVSTHSDILFFHSVNVCILAIMTGISLGYNELSLMELGVGALLHDIGMAFLKPDVFNKPGPLTPADSELVKKHPENGFNVLRAQGEIPLRSSHVAFQHHERWNGSGYPRGMRGNDILEYARIVAVADVFEALVSDRPYREGYAIDDVFTILRKLSDVYFDPYILDIFMSNIAPYPVGGMVKLNNGQVAVVLSTNKANPYRPQIAIVVDADGSLLCPALKIDLSQERHIQIVKILTGKEFKLFRLLLNNSVTEIRQNKPRTGWR
ncbi:MAG: HD-GYP domain-containing protein [Syntrophothermus sp.]|uniref:HD-GYP domain-containing protein n=1 Tax=Syntrophothermus sp. TaxID=2736299 RepID=UPI002581067D|nr:HD-GYP domain-containing protein [Syntrophothermus sp.]NSW83268.1 HD-GYP domain-containing protein [Syntrophothermus sp.]